MIPSKRLVPVLLGLLAIACAPGDQPPDSADVGIDTTTSTSAAPLAFEGDFGGPLGLQLWSVRERMQEDVAGTLAWVRQQGFTEVETAGTEGLTVEAFREELDRAGLRATAMHAPYELLRDSMEVVFAQAQTLGASDVGVAWIPHEGSFTPEMARQAAADFNRWGAAAREHGLRFYYHNHGYEFEPAPDGTIPFDILMEETSVDDVVYEMDVYWTVHPGVDPVELLRRYPDRWKLMHVKDMAQGVETGVFTGYTPDEAKVVVGTGQIDFAALLAAAEEVGVEKYYVEDESPDPTGNIPLTLDYLKTLRY